MFKCWNGWVVGKTQSLFSFSSIIVLFRVAKAYKRNTYLSTENAWTKCGWVDSYYSYLGYIFNSVLRPIPSQLPACLFIASAAGILKGALLLSPSIPSFSLLLESLQVALGLPRCRSLAVHLCAGLRTHPGFPLNGTHLMLLNKTFSTGTDS